jgi:hypothetical protein
MDGDDSAPPYEEQRSLEDELRSRFGSDVLVDNDQMTVDNGSEHGDILPPDDDQEEEDEHMNDEGEIMDYDDLQPMDLRAGSTHRVSDSEEETDENPLRRMIQKRRVSSLNVQKTFRGS